jgi:hypothetical protein
MRKLFVAVGAVLLAPVLLILGTAVVFGPVLLIVWLLGLIVNATGLTVHHEFVVMVTIVCIVVLYQWFKVLDN